MSLTGTSSPPIAEPARPKPGYLAAIGVATGLGALAASSCCVIPLGLAGLGGGAGVFSLLEALVPLRWPLIAVSGAALAGAWFLHLRRRQACATDAGCAPPSRTVPVVLTVAILLLATAGAWDLIEPLLLWAMRRGI